MTTASRTPLGDLWRKAAGPTSGPRALDALWTGVFIALAVFEAVLRSDLDWPGTIAAVTIGLLALLPWRRTHPFAGVATIFLTTTIFQVIQRLENVGPDTLASTLPLLAFPYSLFRWGSGRARAAGAPLLALGVLLSTVFSSESETVAAGLAGTSIVGALAALGALNRERAAARVREIERTRARERESLARDLHDTVSHHFSAIAIRAQVAGLQDADAPTAASLRMIEREAQEALRQMRELVSVLRVPVEFTPTSLESIAALEDSGPPAVIVRIDAAGLPATVTSTLYRIAQEGVANARRHAVEVSSVVVDLAVVENTAVLTVGDDGRGTRASGGEPRYGLIGVAERVTLLGGTFTAGPSSQGWTLRAEIPLPAAHATRKDGVSS